MSEAKINESRAVLVRYEAGTELAKKHPRGEDVLVRRLSIDELYTFAELMNRRETPTLVCLCVDRDKVWLSAVSDESFGELSQMAIAINFHRAATLSGKDPVLAAIVLPQIRSVQQVRQMAHGMIGYLSSLESASSPAGPGESPPATRPSSSSPSSPSMIDPKPGTGSTD